MCHCGNNFSKRDGTGFERRWFKPAGVECMINDADQSVEAEFLLWRIIKTKLWVRQFWGGDS